LTQAEFLQYGIEDALQRSWLKLPRALEHTDLYFFRKETPGSAAVGTLWTHTPHVFRPWGVDVPVASCVCSCAARGLKSFWYPPNTKASKVQGEVYYAFRTSCCKFELHLAIFTGSLRVLKHHGTEIVKSRMDEEGNKEFNYSTMTCIKLKVCSDVDCAFKPNISPSFQAPLDRPFHQTPV
jgi:hypothetical protein